MSAMRRISLVVLVVIAAVPVGRAAAAAPANDHWRTPTALSALPASADGSTVGATSAETDWPGPPTCSSGSDDVWYEVTPTAGARMVVRLEAKGDLDAAVEVFRRVRSQVYGLSSCDSTNEQGIAALLVDVRKGSTYLIRVARRLNSSNGAFHLSLTAQPPMPAPPGDLLPMGGAVRRVDAYANPADAWSALLAEGVTYRVNLAHSPNRCVNLRIFGPGVASFNGPATYYRPCGGYLLLTPGPGRGGRWSFFVQSTASAGGVGQQYRLQIGPAQPNDLTPGTPIGNYATARGRLEGGRLNKVDVYSFDVTSRSYVVLRLAAPRKAGFDLQLLRSSGGRVDCACGGVGDRELRRGLRRGRYLIVVRARHRARGDYRLFRSSREITATHLTADGRRFLTVEHGADVRLTVKVSPRASGPVSIVVDRFDVLSGWHYRTTLRTTAHDGEASVSFRPPHVGTWRAYATFRGTRVASPSSSRMVRFHVASPLRD